MSLQSRLPPGAVDGSRIATPPTCPVWRGVSSARNWASRLVSCLIAWDSALAQACQSQVAQKSPSRRDLARRQRDVPDAAVAHSVHVAVAVARVPYADVLRDPAGALELLHPVPDPHERGPVTASGGR